MGVSYLAIVFFATIISFVQAQHTGSFLIYAEKSSTPPTSDTDFPQYVPSFYHIFETEPDCNDVFTTGNIFPSLDDVSGNRNGVRCVGCSSGTGGTSVVMVMEWQTQGEPYGHYTYYRDRNNAFVDTNDVRAGTCEPYVDTYDCETQLEVVTMGNAQLKCTWDSTATAPIPTAHPANPYKVMVVGDSISHGMEADWTWRWRVSAWLTSQGHAATFVGPYAGTHGVAQPSAIVPSVPLLPGEVGEVAAEYTGRYANGVGTSFSSSGHGAFWGRQAKQVKENIQGWVATYQPDYLLVLLGFNDLGWFVSGPEGLIGDIGQLVQNARNGKPNVQILIGNVVDRAFLEGRQDLVDNTLRYNQLLQQTIPGWFRYESGISYVDVNSKYQCRPGGCPDGYDGLHPNSMGEYHIAQAFAQSLKNDHGFTVSEFPVPASAEARVISTPTAVQVVSEPEGLYVLWGQVPDARGYDIRSRIQGMTDWWSEGMVYPNTWGSLFTWVLDGQTWEYQVRTRGDNDIRSAWSALVYATAHPSTSKGPSNIVSKPSGDGIEVFWDAVTGYDVNRYGVIVWDQDTEGAFLDIHAAAGTSLFIGGLKPGHRYATWVATYVNLKSTWTSAMRPSGGLPMSGRVVIVGGGVPSPPSQLTVVNIDPTTIQLSWPGSAGATGYQLYYRSVKDNTAFVPVGNTEELSYGVGFLFPGTWNYQFCVSAYNGGLESNHNTCVIPPVYPGYTKREVVGNRTIATTSANNGTDMVNDKELQKLYQLFASYNNTASLSS